MRFANVVFLTIITLVMMFVPSPSFSQALPTTSPASSERANLYSIETLPICTLEQLVTPATPRAIDPNEPPICKIVDTTFTTAEEGAKPISQSAAGRLFGQVAPASPLTTEAASIAAWTCPISVCMASGNENGATEFGTSYRAYAPWLSFGHFWNNYAVSSRQHMGLNSMNSCTGEWSDYQNVAAGILYGATTESVFTGQMTLFYEDWIHCFQNVVETVTIPDDTAVAIRIMAVNQSGWKWQCEYNKGLGWINFCNISAPTGYFYWFEYGHEIAAAGSSLSALYYDGWAGRSWVTLKNGATVTTHSFNSFSVPGWASASGVEINDPPLIRTNPSAGSWASYFAATSNLDY